MRFDIKKQINAQIKILWSLIHLLEPKGDQPWDFFGRNDAKADTPVLWPPHAKGWLIGKVSDAGRDSGQDDRGWDSWMASRTRWMWVWVNSGRWWWTGRPGVLRFMWLQRVGHDWATELNWSLVRIECELKWMSSWTRNGISIQREGRTMSRPFS